MNREIRELRNLGPRCEDWLATIGIHDEAGLRRKRQPGSEMLQQTIISDRLWEGGRMPLPRIAPKPRT